MLHTLHCTLRTSHRTLHTEHCTLLTTHCTLHYTTNIINHTQHYLPRTAHYIKLHIAHRHSTLHTSIIHSKPQTLYTWCDPHPMHTAHCGRCILKYNSSSVPHTLQCHKNSMTASRRSRLHAFTFGTRWNSWAENTESTI